MDMNNDFREILTDSSKKLSDIAAAYALESPDRLQSLIDLIRADQRPYSSRAAAVLSVCCETCPEIMDTYQHSILADLKNYSADGIQRSLLKIVANCPVKLNRKISGILVNSCFDWLADPSKPIAIRVYSMQFLYKTAQTETAIIPELIAILEEHFTEGSMGFKSRAGKILKKLYHTKRYLTGKN